MYLLFSRFLCPSNMESPSQAEVLLASWTFFFKLIFKLHKHIVSDLGLNIKKEWLVLVNLAYCIIYFQKQLEWNSSLTENAKLLTMLTPSQTRPSLDMNIAHPPSVGYKCWWPSFEQECWWPSRHFITRYDLRSEMLTLVHTRIWE